MGWKLVFSMYDMSSNQMLRAESSVRLCSVSLRKSMSKYANGLINGADNAFRILGVGVE